MLYVADKLNGRAIRNTIERLGGKMAIYVDDISMRVHRDIPIEEIRDQFSNALLPLKVKWESTDTDVVRVLDMAIAKTDIGPTEGRSLVDLELNMFYGGVSLQLFGCTTVFDSRDRKFGLGKESEIARGVYMSSVRQQILRILDRDGVRGYNKDDVLLFHNQGAVPGGDYLGISHSRLFEKCDICRFLLLGRDKAKSVLDKPSITISLSWSPWLETYLGKKMLSEFKSSLTNDLITVKVRWKFRNSRVSNILFWRSDYVVADDPVRGLRLYRGIDSDKSKWIQWRESKQD